ncbi:MAG: hypothetical protein KAQ63_01760, partial [Candidatus Moranbacteria bacterium]|nr:hypothetical protein [Candidatus Moranbacteria bacterium]
MKKASIYVFLTVVFFVNFSLVLASEERVLEINQKGEVRFVELYKEWKKATKEERLAWESPGREIPAGPKTINQTKRVDFFHFVEKS